MMIYQVFLNNGDKMISVVEEDGSIKSFKNYYTEYTDYYLKLNTLLDTVNQLTHEELNAFGEYLYDHFLDEPEFDLDDFTSFEIKKMIRTIIDSCEDNDEAEFIISSLLDDLSYSTDLSESVSRRMLPSHFNHRRRKFMKKTKAKMRIEKFKRKRLNRMTRMKRKRYYRANKIKIKAYQKSRRFMIKKGRHIVKIRRNA